MLSSRMPTRDRKHERNAQVALAVLRAGLGGILAVHGMAKLNDIAGTAESFASIGLPAPQTLVCLAIAGELLGGLGLAFGLLTRLAALGPVCTMAVAIGTVHASHGLLAKNGGFEYPLLVLLVSAFFAVNGAGAYSLDAAFERRVPSLLRRVPRLRTQLPS